MLCLTCHAANAHACIVQNIVTGQVLGIDAANREVALLQDTDDASGLLQVVASRMDGAIKLRTVVNSKAFLRLGPKAESFDMRGLGGVWTDLVVRGLYIALVLLVCFLHIFVVGSHSRCLQAQLASDGTMSLMSARRPNHYADCDGSVLKAVVMENAEALPSSAKFVVRKVE